MKAIFTSPGGVAMEIPLEGKGKGGYVFMSRRVYTLVNVRILINCLQRRRRRKAVYIRLWNRDLP